MQANRKYERPHITDLGSIAEHTYLVSNGGGNAWGNTHRLFKGGGPIAHCDKHNEWSGGTEPDFPGSDCSDVENPGA